MITNPSRYPTSSPFTSLEVAGHSYPFGDFTSNGHNMAVKLGAMLGVPVTNRAQEGATLTQDDQNPAGHGWATVLQNLPRSAGSAPYLPASSLFMFMYGIVDMGHLATNAATAALVQMHTAVALSRIRAAATGVFEESHASVVLGGAGAWVNLPGTNQNSGAAYQGNATAGATVTISVPSDFPGGTVALGFVNQQGAAATWSFTVDGSGAGSLVLAANAGQSGKANNAYGAVQRFTGLAPGAHTIVATSSAVTSAASFDYWQIEAPNPPTILLLGQPRLTAGGYALFPFNSFPFSPNDASVQLLNQAQAAAAAQFDSAVRFVDMDAIMGNQASLFGTGSNNNQMHPNDAGHALFATAALAAALRGSGPWLSSLATAA